MIRVDQLDQDKQIRSGQMDQMRIDQTFHWIPRLKYYKFDLDIQIRLVVQTRLLQINIFQAISYRFDQSRSGYIDKIMVDKLYQARLDRFDLGKYIRLRDRLDNGRQTVLASIRFD